MALRFNERGPGGPMEASWSRVHPELQMLLMGFVTWSSAEGLPEPVVTDLVRDAEGQKRIYARYWRKLLAAIEQGSPRFMQIDPEGDGTWRPLTMAELDLAKELRGKTDADLRAMAEKRWTWHWIGCAVDLRTRHYSAAQLALVKDWFARQAKRPLWHWLYHDTSGPHLHCERRDYRWRQEYSRAPLTT